MHPTNKHINEIFEKINRYSELFEPGIVTAICQVNSNLLQRQKPKQIGFKLVALLRNGIVILVQVMGSRLTR